MKNKFMEILWLILALLSISIGIYETLSGRFSGSYRFYIFFLVAISVYFLRRNNRKTKKIETETENSAKN